MRILVVEDDARIAADIVATLAAAGYVVETAGDGDEAWFRGDTEDYDLIVLDLGLPKMDGLAVLKRWRAAGRLTPTPLKKLAPPTRLVQPVIMPPASNVSPLPTSAIGGCPVGPPPYSRMMKAGGSALPLATAQNACMPSASAFL